MTYRPSIRMDDAFRDYINELFRATSLDRNQLIRAAIFTAAYSEEYISLIGRYRRQPGVPLPFPIWRADQHGYWMEQSFSEAEKGSDVTYDQPTQERSQRQIHTERKEPKRIEFENTGGIQFKL